MPLPFSPALYHRYDGSTVYIQIELYHLTPPDIQESVKRVVLIPALAPTHCLQFIASRIQNKGLANEMHEQSSAAQCGPPE